MALRHAGADFVHDTVAIDLDKRSPNNPCDGADGRRGNRSPGGSVTGLFPVLHVGGVRIRESLAICEWANEAFPSAQLWPEEPLLRARARSISCEMLSGFAGVRTHLSCGQRAAARALQLVADDESIAWLHTALSFAEANDPEQPGRGVDRRDPPNPKQRSGLEAHPPPSRAWTALRSSIPGHGVLASTASNTSRTRAVSTSGVIGF